MLIMFLERDKHPLDKTDLINKHALLRRLASFVVNNNNNTFACVYPNTLGFL